MSNVFCTDLVEAINLVLARSGEAGVTAEAAVALLEKEGYHVPGDSSSAKAINMRALFAWVDPSVGVSKRGPKGGFVRAENAAPKTKKGQGVISHLKQLQKQGLSDDAIREHLTKLARAQGATGLST